MPDQTKELLDILKEAISIEIYGEEYYSIFSSLIGENNAKSIMKGLRRDECEHREQLEKQYRRIAGKDLDKEVLTEENRKKAMRIFPESMSAMNMKETKNVLELGIRTEKRSIEFYTNSAAKIDQKPCKEMFLRLAAIEEGHRAVLEEAMYYLGQQGSWYGYSPPTIEG